MPDFVLLHGSFHAAWNWHKLLPESRAAEAEPGAAESAGFAWSSAHEASAS